ncbi:hypothetical protein KAR91_57365 [Candidatus Pacearchaeota archaeon]|nr:hypothetical protein [Candidatus Pacearchaeota archaeon]
MDDDVLYHIGKIIAWIDKYDKEPKETAKKEIGLYKTKEEALWDMYAQAGRAGRPVLAMEILDKIFGTGNGKENLTEGQEKWLNYLQTKELILRL